MHGRLGLPVCNSSAGLLGYYQIAARQKLMPGNAAVVVVRAGLGGGETELGCLASLHRRLLDAQLVNVKVVKNGAFNIL